MSLFRRDVVTVFFVVLVRTRSLPVARAPIRAQADFFDSRARAFVCATVSQTADNNHSGFARRDSGSADDANVSLIRERIFAAIEAGNPHADSLFLNPATGGDAPVATNIEIFEVQS
jgi:hypothetical protein